MLEEMGKKARAAARSLAKATTGQKNAVLTRIAGLLLASQDKILAAGRRSRPTGRLNGCPSRPPDPYRAAPGWYPQRPAAGGSPA